MHEPSLRRAASADRAVLLELLAVQLAEQHVRIDSERLARAIDGVLARPDNGFLLLAEQRGETVGVAYVSFMWSLEHGGRCAWLEELYVRPALRSRGTGSALLHAAQQEARASGCAAMDLEVSTGNERAARLYRRDGFGPLGRHRWVKSL